MRIELESRPDHLYALATGSFDHAQLEGILKDIFAESSRQGLRKILIDIRTLEGNISVLARHDAGEMVAKFQREPVRLTIVGTKNQIWPDRFMENVANNRGVTTKVTIDMAEALEWLRRDAVHKPAGGDVK